MLDQDSGDDDDKTTIRLRYLYRGEHKRDGRVATIACKDGAVKSKEVLAALRRDRSVDLDRFGVALYDVKEEAWRTLTELDDEVAVEGEARAELYDTLESVPDDAADEAGYFGIGIVRCKTAGNAGVLWRSAAQLGAAFTFTVGARFEKDADVGGGVADECESKRSARTRRWQVVRVVATGAFGTLSATKFARDRKTSLSLDDGFFG